MVSALGGLLFEIMGLIRDASGLRVSVLARIRRGSATDGTDGTEKRNSWLRDLGEGLRTRFCLQVVVSFSICEICAICGLPCVFPSDG